MHAELNAEAAFRLTGLHGADELTVPAGGLRPALAARYRDLTRLRYDFPLVLVSGAAEGPFARSLSEVMDELMQAVAAKANGARIAKRLLHLEHGIRLLASNGTSGTLAQLWDAAAAQLGLAEGSEGHEDLAAARASLKRDGEVLDCDARLPERFFLHAWRSLRAAKTRRLQAELHRRIDRLEDVLASDRVRSSPGHEPGVLRLAMGSRDRDTFDFDAMARILDRGLAAPALPEARRERIAALIATIEAASVFDDKDDGCVFHSASKALHAFRVLAPRLSELEATLAMADLEIAGRYDGAQHAALFEQLRSRPVSGEALARYPDFLVCLNVRDLGSRGADELYELLCAGVPAKVVLQSDDLLEEPSVATEAPAIGARSKAIVGMAVGTGEVFVLQSSASNLLRVADRVVAALSHPGPALISVYSGAACASDSLPPYLLAAAAMESRAFPAFAFDPSVRSPDHSPFSLLNNPQPERDWPLHRLEYEDGEHQRVGEDAAFTAADFLACDARYAASLAVAPRKPEHPHPSVDQWLENPPADETHAAPCIRMVDDADMLHELLVGEPVLRQARRTLDAWALLRRLAQAGRPLVVEAPAVATEAAPPPPAAEAAKTAAEPAPSAPASDEPYIETPRCTTCEECVQINKRLFAYDANKQAYIADASAGTYRDLVEAAESCQVSIIHPGKPRDPNEAGLAELLERAAPFL